MNMTKHMRTHENAQLAQNSTVKHKSATLDQSVKYNYLKAHMHTLVLESSNIGLNICSAVVHNISLFL